MRYLLIFSPFILVGCTTVEVVRIPPPATLVTPHEIPHLDGRENSALVRLAEEQEAELRLCNVHKQLIREFYADE